MSDKGEKILAEALGLSPTERAKLIEELLCSFEFPARKSIDELWAQECEDRIDAYERAAIPASPAKEVFDRINKK